MNFTTTVPTELIQQIFAWIPPIETFRLRSINKRIWNCISDPHFASLNLQHFVQLPLPLSSFYPEDLDIGLFAWPGYQAALVELRHKALERIFWPVTKNRISRFAALRKSVGRIPRELGLITNLRVLELPRNPCLTLYGTIPHEIGLLVNLVFLALNNHELEGPIPASIGNLKLLDTIYIGGNKLSGPLPIELGNLTKLERFHALSNQFTGTIPAELGKCVNLQELFLQGNDIVGGVPAELWDLVQLERLNLSRNRLSGEIPVGIERLTHLRELYVGGNDGLYASEEMRGRVIEAVRKCDL